MSPPLGVRGNVRCHLRLIGKLVVDLVIIELFSLVAFVLSQSTRLMDRRTDGFTITEIALHSMPRGEKYIF